MNFLTMNLLKTLERNVLAWYTVMVCNDIPRTLKGSRGFQCWSLKGRKFLTEVLLTAILYLHFVSVSQKFLLGKDCPIKASD